MNAGDNGTRQANPLRHLVVTGKRLDTGVPGHSMAVLLADADSGFVRHTHDGQPGLFEFLAERYRRHPVGDDGVDAH